MNTDLISRTNLAVTEAAVAESATNVIPGGNVVIATRVGLGKVCLLAEDTAINQDLRGIVPKRDRLVIPRYLFYWFRSIASQVVSAGKGMTVQGVTGDFVKALLLPLPPLPEQERIVALLDEAFAAIATATAHAEQNLANAKELFESYCAKVLNGSENSTQTILGDEIDLLAGVAFKSKQYTDDENGIRLLRGDNIIQGGFRWEGVKKWPADDISAYSEFELSAHDVVLAMDRPWVAAGLKRAYVFEKDLPCLLVQRVARLRCRPNLDSRFLFHLIGSRSFIKYILGTQTGIGVPHISGRQILNFSFVKPSVEYQNKIAKEIDSFKERIRSLTSLLKSRLSEYTEVKRSFFQKAFTGELTADQQTADRTLAEAGV